MVHPEVLEKFDVANPVCALELNVEPFCFAQNYRPLPTHLAMSYHAQSKEQPVAAVQAA